MNILRFGFRGLGVTGAIVLLLGIVGAGAATSGTSPVTNAKHFFWAAGQSSSASSTDQLQNDLIYHGGNVGPARSASSRSPPSTSSGGARSGRAASPLRTPTATMYSSKTLQTYMQSFFQNVGGSPWANVQTQYCAYALPGSANCAGGGGFVTNPKGQLKGVWTDPSAGAGRHRHARSRPEPRRRSDRERGGPRPRSTSAANRDATYIVLTPPAKIATGEGAVYCAYHSQTTSVDGLGNPERIQYAFIPWLNENWPASGTGGCGMHSVNATSDAFGNGIFDGWSIVTGHEYSEAVTDPDNFTSIQDGWNDDTTMENADKCAWIDMQNITLGGHKFAVQPTWSNEAFDSTGNGCAVSRP